MIAVPAIEDTSVRELVAHLATGMQPRYIKHQPLPGKPLKECFHIVAEHAARNGGKTVLGWAIIQLIGIWLEAEFHAVWEDPTGNLLDLTPRKFRADEILFIPDPNRTYSGAQVESIFHPLTRHPSVLRNIELAHELFVETNRGELARATSYPMTPKIEQIQAEMEYTLSHFPWQKA